MALTAKQEAFAQCVANGMTQSDAYRSAYDVSPDTKAKSVTELASTLMADVNVSSRVAELKDILAMQQLWTREEAVNTLKEIVGHQESKANEKTAAIKELNSMLGFNATQKHQVTGEVNGSWNINVNLVKPDVRD